MMNEQRFRERLEQITKPRSGRSADLWLPDIEELRNAYPHTIHMVNVHLDRGLNCFAYALGLSSSRSYSEIARKFNVFANVQFVLWLLDNGRLKKNRQPHRSESIVVYFDGSEPKHAGRIRDDRVLSKWGTGFWFHHGTFEIPANYGNSIERYNVPAVQVIEDSFLGFAVSEGVPVRDLVPNWQSTT